MAIRRRRPRKYRVCVGSDGSVFVSGKYNGTVYSLDAGSGGIKWRRPLAERINTLSASDPDGVLYVGTRGNRLYALSSLTGSVKWAMALASFPNTVIGRTYFEAAAGPRGFVYAECADDSIYAVHRP